MKIRNVKNVVKIFAIVTILIAVSITLSIHTVSAISLTQYLKNMLKLSSMYKCNIAKIKDYYQKYVILLLKCGEHIGNSTLSRLNCTYNGTYIICNYSSANIKFKVGKARYMRFNIYAIEQHIKTIGTISAYPVISLTNILSCSSKNICTIMVYSMSNLKNIILIVPKDVDVLYCEGLNVDNKFNIGNYTMYLMTLKSQIKAMYSSKDIFYARCAVFKHGSDIVKINMILTCILFAFVCGLFAIVLYSLITSRLR